MSCVIPFSAGIPEPTDSERERYTALEARIEPAEPENVTPAEPTAEATDDPATEEYDDNE